MIGTTTLPTVDDIRAAWETAAVARGRELRSSRQTLRARVDWNRWLVDCPCGGAAAAWPEHDRACCLDCFTIHPVSFPDADERAAAGKVLDQRPTDADRHWDPRDESVADLKAENAVRGHGFVSA